jgi:hypothetical protein
MLSPDELIGQRVWINIPKDPDFPDYDFYRIKATLTQPTSPPWFYARFEDMPPAVAVKMQGQWLSLNEAQQAVLLHPVVDDYDLDYEDDLDDYDDDDWQAIDSKDKFRLN